MSHDHHKPPTIPILAAQKIIADISSGLYRSPAAALKELVANAYDADAEKVVIVTDAPHFRTLVVRDTGSGMSLEKFLDALHHLGGSRKRIIEGDVTPKGRQIIGRIGIGLLAIAQLGFRFYVSSSVAGVPTRFIAEVNMAPFHKDDVALQRLGKIKEESDEVEIGSVTYVKDIPEESDAHYTVITIPEVKKGIISEISGAVRKVIDAPHKLSIANQQINKFEELVEVTREACTEGTKAASARSVSRAETLLDAYYYMLWELALLCPVNYLDHGPFETSQQTIEVPSELRLPSPQKFKLIVDGVEIRRPQLFPTPRHSATEREVSGSANPIIYRLDFDRHIAGRRLKFYGYIYCQQARICPLEISGLHIRIRNVGIGGYDHSWLGYPFDEEAIFGQMSGEIYVEHGLESALNIDRDSFITTEVHYQAMRAYVWDTLHRTVFPNFKSRAAQSQTESRLPTDPVNEFSLDNNEKKRLRSVLTALASSKVLADMPDEKVNSLLRTLASAVK